MSSENKQKTEFEVLFQFLKRYRLPLFFVSFICAVVSAVISLMIPKEYISSAVVFPPASLSLDLSTENPNFGYDIEADRLLQILQSKEIRDSVIRRFNLADYYEIDRKALDWVSKTDRAYRKDVEFKRSTFMSIVISCQTKDPELSANIVNYILEMGDKVREKIYKQNVKLAYTKVQDEYNVEKAITDSLYTILKKRFSEEGVSGLLLLAPNAQLNFNLQQTTGKKSEASDVSLLGAEILKYRFHFDRQNEYEMRLKRIGKMLEYPVSRIHILDSAEPNYRKTYPMVTLNVMVSFVLGFFFTSIYYIIKPRA
jgi:capsular polysaccharide biosynthesis protein